MRARSQYSGMTLVELVITIVVISIAMVAVLTAFSGAMGRSADPLWRNKTLKLAQLYLDEISTKKFDESTPVGGVPASTTVNCNGLGAEEADRSLYDDVDDYHNLSEIPPLSQKGATLNGYAGYRVQVSVVCSGALVGAIDNSQVKKISLTITPPGEPPVLFSSFVGNF